MTPIKTHIDASEQQNVIHRAFKAIKIDQMVFRHHSSSIEDPKTSSRATYSEHFTLLVSWGVSMRLLAPLMDPYDYQMV